MKKGPRFIPCECDPPNPWFYIADNAPVDTWEGVCLTCGKHYKKKMVARNIAGAACEVAQTFHITGEMTSCWQIDPPADPRKRRRLFEDLKQ